MTCSRCSAENATDARFCAACGAPLGPEWEAIGRIVDQQLEQKIRKILKEQFADQKALEIETSELIAERVLKWAKAFGFFVGIPVAVIIAFLGFVGFKTWSDVTSAREKINVASSELSAAEDQAHKALADANSFQIQLHAAQAQLAAIPEIQQKQRDLEIKFRNFTYCGEGTSSLESMRKIDDVADRYRKYLVDVGLTLPAEIPQFCLSDKTASQTTSPSYYDPSSNKIVVNKVLIDDPTTWLREFTHQVIFNKVTQTSLIPGSTTKEVGAVYPIESTVAFYLPCSFLDDPAIGKAVAKMYDPSKSYVFNLDQKTNFGEYQTLDPVAQQPYRGAEIVGAIFWEVRALMDHRLADRLVVASWLAFTKTNPKPDMLGWLRIYRRQFDDRELQKYRADIDRVFRTHNVPL